MNILSEILFKILFFIKERITFHDLGWAIIVFTLFFRLILLPWQMSSQRAQRKLSFLSEKIQKIRQKYPEDKKRQNVEILQLYQQERLNPFAGLLFFLLQIPIFFLLYEILKKDIVSDGIATFMGIIPLGRANAYLALLVGLTQFFQKKPRLPSPSSSVTNPLSLFSKTLTIYLPFLTFFVFLKLPAGLALYFIANSLFSIVIDRTLAKKI